MLKCRSISKTLSRIPESPAPQFTAWKVGSLKKVIVNLLPKCMINQKLNSPAPAAKHQALAWQQQTERRLAVCSAAFYFTKLSPSFSVYVLFCRRSPSAAASFLKPCRRATDAGALTVMLLMSECVISKFANINSRFIVGLNDLGENYNCVFSAKYCD